MFGRLFDLSPERGAAGGPASCSSASTSPTPADRPARTYSGGMRRRLDLASSLLTRPRILFLDEPTTGLDPRSRNEIWAIVRELVREGTTLLLTTQYLEEADQLADRIAVIDHGRVIAEGTGNELKDRVGGQILEVELANAGAARRGRGRARRVGCGEPEPGERPDRLTLPAPRDGLELIEDAAAALRQAEIGVSDLGLRRPTLDDVFLQLTGAPPSEDGDGPRTTRPIRGRTDRRRAGAAALQRPRLAGGAASTVRSTRCVVTGRNLRHFIRQPQLLIFSTIQPIMFVLLFVYVFGGAIRARCPPASPTSTSCCPGSSSSRWPSGRRRPRSASPRTCERGVIDRFRSMPMARSAVLIGRTLADLVRNVLIIVLMIVVGYIDRLPLPRGRADTRSAASRSSRLRLRAQLDLRLRRAHGAGAPRRRSRPASS